MILQCIYELKIGYESSIEKLANMVCLKLRVTTNRMVNNRCEMLRRGDP